MARFRRESVVTLVSGGFDSLILVRRLLARGAVVWPVYVRCGLRWEGAEQAALRRWLAAAHHRRLRPLGLLELPVASLYMRGHWSRGGHGVPSASSREAAVYLPGRNVLLLGAAAIYAQARGAGRLALGTLAGNPFGDASPEFFRDYARALSRALGLRIVIEAPLRRLTKGQLIAADPGAPSALTLSCIAPRQGRHCGRCNKCAERRRAFRQAGIGDPSRYAS